MKHLRAWLGTAFVLWWLWMLLAGQWNRDMWIAATVAAAIAAAVGEGARSRAGVDAPVPARWLLRGWSSFLVVVVDFAIVTWALVRSASDRTIVRGEFFAREDSDIGSPGIRAWRTVLGTYSPNAYVVDMEADRGLVLVHDLIPRRASEEPA